MKRSHSILLFSVLFIGSNLTALGQSKLALSVNLAPVYSHQSSSALIPDFAPVNPGLTTLKSNSYLFSYSLGLMARYSFSPKWSVSTGIWASHPFAGQARITQGSQSSSTPYEYNRPLNNQYKIPVTVNFRPSANRISPYFSAGTTFDFRQKSYVSIDGSGREVPVKFGKPVAVTPIVGAGAIVDLKENLSLVVQPTFQYLIQSQEGYEYRRAYLVGLQTQLMYRF